MKKKANKKNKQVLVLKKGELKTIRLQEQYKVLCEMKTLDIFQQIKKADIARKLGIDIIVSETVLDALNFKRPKAQQKKGKQVCWKKMKQPSKGGPVKVLKYGSSVPTEYKDYITSRFWKERKAQFFEKIEKRCAACNSLEDICLHHMMYGVLGKEKDEHLIPLCKGCHEEYHSANGVQQDMINKTLQFVESKQFSLIVDRM